MEQTNSQQGDELGLAEHAYALQPRKKRVFTTKVAISWVALLLFLLYLFSGSDLVIAGVQLKTINLETTFIQET